MTLARTGLALAALIASVAAPARVHVQVPARRFADNPIRHVGVIVRDVERTAKIYADVFGMPVPPIREVTGVPFPSDYQGDRTAHPKVTTFQLNNLSIELLQPMGGQSPWKDHLDKYGQSLHHIAFGVPNVDEAVQHLVKHGGKYVLGGPGYAAAYVQMEPQFGFTIELNQVAAAAPASPQAPAPATTKFGSGAVSHIGVWVPDVEKTAAAFADTMGIDVPKATEYQPIVYPADFKGDKDGHPKIVSVRLPGSRVSVEFAQPIGGASPWREQVTTFGPSMNHLGIGISGMLDSVAYLQKLGGRVTTGGKADVSYTFVDLRPEPLGMTIELNGK